MGARATLRSPGQNARLWALVGQFPLSREDAEEVLRATCRAVSGQEHSSRLTVGQATDVIQRLEAQVEKLAAPAPTARPAPTRQPWGPRGPGRRNEQPIRPAQQKLIQALFVQAGLDTTEQQRGFTMRQCKLPWAQTQAHADALVEALTAMVLRRVPAAEAEARVRAVLAHPDRSELHPVLLAILVDIGRQYDEAKKPEKVMTTHKLKKLCEAEEVLCLRPT